jgi:hypothetical protein
MEHRQFQILDINFILTWQITPENFTAFSHCESFTSKIKIANSRVTQIWQISTVTVMINFLLNLKVPTCKEM